MGQNNEIRISGRIFADPETRGKVMSMRVSVSSYRRKKDASADDKYPNETNWFRVVFFSKLHEAARAFRKGDWVTITGSLELTKYFSQTKQCDVDAVEVHAETIEAQERNAPMNGGAPRAPSRAPQREQASPRPAVSEVPEFFDDDVPF